MAFRIVAASLLAITVAGVAPASSHATVQRTIVRTPRPIVALDSDGRLVAWRTTLRLGAARVPCNAVRRLRIGRSGIERVTRCTGEELGDRVSVDGATVFWTRRVLGGQSCCDTIVDERLGAAPGRPRWFESAERTVDCGGTTLGAQSARGGVFAFARTTWTITAPIPPEGCGHAQPGDTVTGGSAMLVGQTRTPAPLAGSPPTVMLAVDAGRVALVPYALHPGTPGEPPADASVQVWTIGSAAPPVTVPLSVPPTAVALTRSTVAVIVDDRLERYDAATGAPLGIFGSVPGLDPHLLTARGGTIAYVVNHSIRAMNAATRASRVVVRTRRHPGALAVGHGRVVWTVAAPTGSSIHVAALP